MLKNYIKRIFALSIISTTLLAIVPVSAHAEWRSVANKWYWREGDSYVKGWKLIDSKWYYFDNNGAMTRNTMIDGYYITGSGVAVSITFGDLPIRTPSTWIEIDKVNGKSYNVDDKAALVYKKTDTFGYSESSFIDGMKEALTDRSADVQVSNKTYNGRNATCLEYQYKDNSKNLKGAIIIFFKDNTAYAFCIASRIENYNDSKRELEDMLNLTLSL